MLRLFFDIFKFPIVPKDIEDEYLELRNKKTFVEAGERFVVQRDIAKVMVYNIKYNWRRLVEAVEKGKVKYPTHRIIARNLMHDPVKKIQLVSDSSVDKWMKEIYNKVPVEVQQTIVAMNELPEEEEKEITFEDDIKSIEQSMKKEIEKEA